MPNDLTQSYSKSVPRSRARSGTRGSAYGLSAGATEGEPLDEPGFGLDSQDELQLSSMEQIRQDLDDADNVFGVFYANKPLKRNQGDLLAEGSDRDENQKNDGDDLYVE